MAAQRDRAVDVFDSEVPLERDVAVVRDQHAAVELATPVQCLEVFREIAYPLVRSHGRKVDQFLKQARMRRLLFHQWVSGSQRWARSRGQLQPAAVRGDPIIYGMTD